MADRIAVRVRVPDLLKKVEQARAKAITDHERAKAKYDADLYDYKKRAVAALHKAAADAAKGKFPKNSYYGLQVKVPGGEEPCRPSLSLKDFDRDIAVLKMASDESISITTNNHFVRYL